MVRRRSTRRQGSPSSERRWDRFINSDLWGRYRPTADISFRGPTMLHSIFLLLHVLIMHSGQLRTAMFPSNVDAHDVCPTIETCIGYSNATDDGLKKKKTFSSLNITHRMEGSDSVCLSIEFLDENNFEILDGDDILFDLNTKLKEIQLLRIENEIKIEEDEKNKIEEDEKKYLNDIKQQEELFAAKKIQDDLKVLDASLKNLLNFDILKVLDNVDIPIKLASRFKEIKEYGNKMKGNKEKYLKEIGEIQQELLDKRAGKEKSFQISEQEPEAAENNSYLDITQQEPGAIEQMQDEASTELPGAIHFAVSDENETDDEGTVVTLRAQKVFSPERQYPGDYFEFYIFGTCTDEDGFLYNFRQDGSVLGTAPDTVHAHRPRSCLLCPNGRASGDPPIDLGVCRDTHDSCFFWAKELDECLANPKYMHRECARSCGMCPDQQASVNPLIDFEVCRDTNENCAFWAKDIDECRNNLEFMQRHCTRSCGMCPTSASRSEAMSEAADLYRKGYWLYIRGVPQEFRVDHVEEIRRGIKKTMEYLRDAVASDVKYDDVKHKCVNRKNDCAYWAMLGECEANRGFMESDCAPSCKACHLLIDNKQLAVKKVGVEKNNTNV